MNRAWLRTRLRRTPRRIGRTSLRLLLLLGLLLAALFRPLLVLAGLCRCRGRDCTCKQGDADRGLKLRAPEGALAMGHDQISSMALASDVRQMLVRYSASSQRAGERRI